MCDIVRSRLIAWIDDELEPAEKALVSAHIERCEECRNEIASLRSLTSDVAEYARAIGERKDPRWRWAPAAAAAAVLLAAALRLVETTAPGPHVSARPQALDPREPSVLVAVPVEDLLPIGAAPPGAVIVGHFVLDPGGNPRKFQLEQRQGD